MPRRKKLDDALTVTLVLTRQLKARAEAYARSKGMSLSELVRLLLERELAESGAPPAEEPQAVPPRENPLDALERREFKEALDRLEALVGRALEAVSGRGVPLGYQASADLPRYWELRQRWQTLKRWYKTIRFGEEALEVAERLVRVYEQIELYGKRTHVVP